MVTTEDLVPVFNCDSTYCAKKIQTWTIVSVVYTYVPGKQEAQTRARVKCCVPEYVEVGHLLGRQVLDGS